MSTLICSLMCGVNVWYLVAFGMNPWNVASGVICGLLAIACAVMDAA